MGDNDVLIRCLANLLFITYCWRPIADSYHSNGFFKHFGVPGKQVHGRGVSAGLPTVHTGIR